MNRFTERDEREIGIDRAADRLAYIVMSYGLLLIVAWRSLAFGEASWDLLGLVLLGGVVGTIYRLVNGAVSQAWLALAGVSVVVGLVVAALVVLGTRG
jgi:hypothetical protein